MSKQINILYLSPNRVGGWVTFTAHLIAGFKARGIVVNMYTIGNNSEEFYRDFGYDLQYRNITLSDAKKLKGSILITAVGKKFVDEAAELLRLKRCRIVIHDPTELHADLKPHVKRPIVIRKSMKSYFDDSVYIGHPYQRKFGDDQRQPKSRARRAISISRIDFDKNTHLLLDANRISKGVVEIRGFENRLYTKFKIIPEYPEWEQSKVAYPRRPDEAAEMCKNFMFMVDMSVIKGDGGGTQYTFLEAMDAGAVCILHEDWLLVKGGEMRAGFNCLAAETGEEIHRLIRKTPPSVIMQLRSSGYELLKKHDAKVIARKYAKELGL